MFMESGDHDHPLVSNNGDQICIWNWMCIGGGQECYRGFDIIGCDHIAFYFTCCIDESDASAMPEQASHMRSFEMTMVCPICRGTLVQTQIGVLQGGVGSCQRWIALSVAFLMPLTIGVIQPAFALLLVGARAYFPKHPQRLCLQSWGSPQLLPVAPL